MKSYIGAIIGIAVHVSTVQAQVNFVKTIPGNSFAPQLPFKAIEIRNPADNVRLLSPDDLKLKLPTDPEFLAMQMNGIIALCPLLQKPVTVELDAQRKNNENAQLNWKTENALNGQQFVIERSFDDTLHFETVNYVWPKGEYSEKERYDLLDNNSFQRLTYYRVRLDQSSGKQLYSNIAEVKGYSLHNFKVYPNPSSNTINLAGYNDANNIVGIKITDGTGKIVWQQNGFRSQMFYQKAVNIEGLSKGLYFVKFELADHSKKTLSFIKQ